MSCEGLIQRIGFTCREVRDAVIAVETPFSFADGDPITFYLNDRKNLVVLSDNADTLAHMASIGYDISDRRKWKPIRQLVATFGFELNDNGEITGSTERNNEGSFIASYIAAMLALADFEREYLGVPEELDKYIEEVEFQLRAWKPRAELVRMPVIQGHSGRGHIFHFDFDGKLIDAARPHNNRTGSILRKAADVINAGNQKPILIVMDDREDPEKASIETDILSTMVSVMPFTRLEEHGKGNLLQ